MAKLSIVAGATSQSVNIKIYILASGAAQTGLVFNSTGLTAYYTFTGANATATSIALATLAAVNSAYSSGGFKEIDATHQPGLYRFDIPNAAIAASKGRAVNITFTGFSGMADCDLEIELTGWDNQDAVHGGMSCLPNTGVTTNGSLVTSGTGTDQLSVASGRIDAGKILGTAISTPATAGILDVNVKNMNNVAATPITTINANIGETQPINFNGTGASAMVKVDVEQVNTQTATAAAGVTFPSSIASPTNLTAGTLTTVTNLTNAPTAGDFTAAMKTSLNAATPASVTGAVGSVTGNVGGNVVGSVASVTAAVMIDGTSALTEAYAAQGAALTLSKALYGITQQLGQQSISGTTMTVLKRDGATMAKTYTLNSATVPTSISETT